MAHVSAGMGMGGWGDGVSGIDGLHLHLSYIVFCVCVVSHFSREPTLACDRCEGKPVLCMLW